MRTWGSRAMPWGVACGGGGGTFAASGGGGAGFGLGPQLWPEVTCEHRRGGRLGRVIQVADCSDESYLQRRDCATALPKAYRHKHMHTQHHTAQQRETERERVLQRHRFRREYSTAQHSLSRRGTGQSTQLNRQTRTETTAKKMHRLSSPTCLLLCLDDALHPLLGALFWGRTLRPNVQVWLFISEILEGGEATFRP